MSLAGGTGYYPEGCLSLPDFSDSSWTAWDGLDGTGWTPQRIIIFLDGVTQSSGPWEPGALVPVIGHWILDLSDLHAILMGP
jgi:hypothetical protein